MSVGWSRAEASDSVKRLAATWAWPSITFNSSIHTSTCDEGFNTTWVLNPHEKRQRVDAMRTRHAKRTRSIGRCGKATRPSHHQHTRQFRT